MGPAFLSRSRWPWRCFRDLQTRSADNRPSAASTGAPLGSLACASCGRPHSLAPTMHNSSPSLADLPTGSTPSGPRRGWSSVATGTPFGSTGRTTAARSKARSPRWPTRYRGDLNITALPPVSCFLRAHPPAPAPPPTAPVRALSRPSRAPATTFNVSISLAGSDTWKQRRLCDGRLRVRVYQGRVSAGILDLGLIFGHFSRIPQASCCPTHGACHAHF